MKVTVVVVLALPLCSISLPADQVTNAAQPTVTIKPSPTSPWIEVYHDGVLTSEWQPADGLSYWLLWLVIEDELGHVQRPRTPKQGHMMLATL
jgi:hypothetical protein